MILRYSRCSSWSVGSSLNKWDTEEKAAIVKPASSQPSSWQNNKKDALIKKWIENIPNWVSIGNWETRIPRGLIVYWGWSIKNEKRNKRNKPNVCRMYRIFNEW